MWASSLNITDAFLAGLTLTLSRSLFLLLLQRNLLISFAVWLANGALGFFKAFKSLQVLKNSKQFSRQVFIYLGVTLYFKEFFPGSAERLSGFILSLTLQSIRSTMVTRKQVAFCSNFWLDFFVWSQYDANRQNAHSSFWSYLMNRCARILFLKGFNSKFCNFE